MLVILLSYLINFFVFEKRKNLKTRLPKALQEQNLKLIGGGLNE